MEERQRDLIWGTLLRSARTSPTLSAYLTCTATSGNGAPTGPPPTPINTSKTPQVLQRAQAACCAAGRVAYSAGIAARLTAASASPATVTTTSVSGSSASLRGLRE